MTAVPKVEKSRVGELGEVYALMEVRNFGIPGQGVKMVEMEKPIPNTLSSIYYPFCFGGQRPFPDSFHRPIIITCYVKLDQV